MPHILSLIYFASRISDIKPPGLKFLTCSSQPSPDLKQTTPEFPISQTTDQAVLAATAITR